MNNKIADEKDNKYKENNQTDKEEKDQDQKEKSPAEKTKEKIGDISAGIVSGYVGEYLENVFLNILNREEEFLKDNSTSVDYVVSIIQSGTEGLLADKLSDFNAVVLATGLQYALYQAFNEILGKEEENLLQNFIIDVIIIYFLILGYNLLTKNPFDNNDEEEGGFLKGLSEGLPKEVLVSLYYAFKTFIRNKKEEKKKENDDKKKLRGCGK